MAKKVKTVFDIKKNREEEGYQKRLSEFIQKRKKDPSAVMRELRSKRAKSLNIKPKEIGLDDDEDESEEE